MNENLNKKLNESLDMGLSVAVEAEQIAERIINKRHKDRLFRKIFGSEEYKENTLALYNVLNNSSYDNPDELEFKTIDDVIYIGMKNDLSFLIEEYTIRIMRNLLRNVSRFMTIQYLFKKYRTIKRVCLWRML